MLTEKQKIFLEIYKNNLGNVTEACKKARVESRQTFYNWMAENEDFRQAVHEIQESLLDFVESQQFLLIRGVPKYKEIQNPDGSVSKEFIGWIERPDRNLIQFYLQTKGKSRGYVEKKELEINTPEQQRLQRLSDYELENEIKQLLSETNTKQSRKRKTLQSSMGKEKEDNSK